MPAMGEGIVEATLTKIFKSVGDSVMEDEALMEVATDKVDSEITSTASGIITKINYKENDIVPVGAVLISLSTDTKGASIFVEETKRQEQIAAKTDQPQAQANPQAYKMESRTQSGKFLSPLVRNIAKQEKLSVDQIDSIQGTGADGRITKDDVLRLIDLKKQAPAPQAKIQIQPDVEWGIDPNPTVMVEKSGNFDIIEMDRMRRLIAENMLASKRISPHVTSFMEVDVTGMVQWRDKVKDSFQKKQNEKLTFTPLFIEAIVKALKDFPMVNVSVDGTKIIIKKDINIGMATALTNGNLIVPVIKQADMLNLQGLAHQVNDLADRARRSKLKPEEIRGSTFTITNIGSFGNLAGTPIINQPEVAILAVGAIKKKPAVIETPQGDLIGIRSMWTVL